MSCRSLLGCGGHRQKGGDAGAQGFDRRRAAIGHQAFEPGGGQAQEALGQRFAFARFVALDMDEEAALGKARQHLVEGGHQADALAAERISLAAVRRVAMADVERLELRQRFLAGDAATVGSAIERPVVKHRDMTIRRRMHVEFDDVSAGGEGSVHRSESVLQIGVLRRVDAARGAGRVRDARGRISLRQVAMSQQDRPCAGSRREQAGVLDEGDGNDRADRQQDAEPESFHRHPLETGAMSALQAGEIQPEIRRLPSARRCAPSAWRFPVRADAAAAPDRAEQEHHPALRLWRRRHRCVRCHASGCAPSGSPA
jgi:hypothetical protein